MPLVGASPVYRPPVAGEPLRLRDDGHWSTDGLILYSPMDEMSGGVVRDVARGHNAILAAAAAWSSDGVNCSGGGMTYPNAARDAIYGANALTVSAWASSSGPAAGTQEIVSLGQVGYGASAQVFRLEVHRYNFLMFTVSDGTTENSALLAPPSYGPEVHHICGVFNQAAGSVQLWWDGKLLKQDPAAIGALNTYNVPLRVGANWTSDTQYRLQGNVRAVSIYTRAFSPAQITALYAAPDLPIWRPRRGISLALLGESAAVGRAYFGTRNLGAQLLRRTGL